MSIGYIEYIERGLKECPMQRVQLQEPLKDTLGEAAFSSSSSYCYSFLLLLLLLSSSSSPLSSSSSPSVIIVFLFDCCRVKG